MRPPVLLITAAIDLDDGDWFVDCWERAARAMCIGKAGDVRHGRVPGAALAERDEAVLAYGRTVQARRTSFRQQEDGSYVLFAGRIFNSSELQSRFGLSAIDHPADLYAAVHARAGLSADSCVVGDYAAVQWFPDRRKLRLVRSPTSSRPLHVWREGPRIVVSSLPGPILACGIPSRIDETYMGDELFLNKLDGRRSWYAGMHRVECGTWEEHDPAGETTRRYWSLKDVPEVRFRNDDDYVEALDDHFRTAVKLSMEGAKAPSISLSGGFDSQTVASYAVENLAPGQQLRSFTAVPVKQWIASQCDQTLTDESHHVRALCAMYPQIDARFVDGARLRYGERLQQHMLVGGWPSYNEPNTHWGHEALEQAVELGCDLMLTGDSGNVGFSYDGLTGYPTWLRTGRWLRLLREIAASDDPRPFWRKLLSLSVMPYVPVRWKRRIDANRAWRKPPFVSWCPLRPEWAAESGVISRADAVGYDFDFYSGSDARTDRDLALRDSASVSPEIELGFQLLYGVPSRDPTAYVPLLEFCVGVPDEQYLRNGVSRWLARRLMRGRVPEVVWSEKRRGRQASDWPGRFERDRDDLLVEMTRMKNDPRLAPVFDFDRMERALREWDGSASPQNVSALTIQCAIGRGVAAARFVNYVEGRNVS